MHWLAQTSSKFKAFSRNKINRPLSKLHLLAKIIPFGIFSAKSAQKVLIFSNKANFERDLILQFAFF